MDAVDLLAKVTGQFPEEKLALLRETYLYAAEAHAGQMRQSGEPFIEHPLQTALVLADLQVDLATLQAALLHDVVEDSGVSVEELERRFGAEVSRLVDGVTKLARIGLPAGERSEEDGARSVAQAESLRKMLVAMAQDLRVVLIKLADRLHNMRTLGALPLPRRRRIAQETRDIYAPLAHRLGISEINWELEDLAFRHLDPGGYRDVSRLLASTRRERERYIRQVTTVLKMELGQVGLGPEVMGRPKHLYSIYQKMRRYAADGRQFGEIYDLLAVRIIVETVQECYAALGVVHSLWRPLPGQFDDYIASPRENGYRSLHTTVLGLENKPLEIQIRTQEMHRVAEYGVAAHWRYKEGGVADMLFEERVTWLRQLLEWQREVTGAEEFVEQVKMDILPEQVFVYTPKGDVIELPSGSTPLDFAYRIHTDLGHKATGARANGRMVSFDYRLKNGDTVEMLTVKGEKGPSLDWLNTDLGYVRTAHARTKIRQWFRRQERAENIARGKHLLEREAKHLGLLLDPAELAHIFKYDSPDELLLAMGTGSLGMSQVASRLTPQEERPQVRITPRGSEELEVTVPGLGSVAARAARCCRPLPGDEIVGFITRVRGVTVHRRDCPNIRGEDEPERMLTVSWMATEQLYPATVRVEAWDRVGLLRDITTLVSAERVNIAGVSDRHDVDKSVTIYLTLETTGLPQLSRLLSRLEGVSGVVNVDRLASGAVPQSVGR